MLDKQYNASEVEQRIYEKWESSGCFRCGQKERLEQGASPYTIVIPPPNVTGSLHMGHALNNTLQDILVRFERLRGKDVLWQPGTDHAGIATQMVVERMLDARGEPGRRELGREKFIERIWEWKEKSGGTIINQLKRLGASCDWDRERFTMDEGLSRAVLRVFVDLYKVGLIYRDKRLVNWDPKLHTAISDLEVENIEVDGHFWHFKYPLENGEVYEFPIEHDDSGKPVKWETRDYISIATTRPETMLGDGAVAVHPSDARYAPIVGKRVLLPLANRYIPIITDEHPDPDFGSGAVKITGAHDFNDYQVARRHDLPMFVIMDENGCMAGEIPEKYIGMDRFEARKLIVEDIDKLGLLLTVEDKKIMQPFGDRSRVVIEPMLTDQWYVDAQKLAEPAIRVVRDGRIKFVPQNWEKTYFQWMDNIEPWCISRQLWWGHQIPVWYGPDGQYFVALNEEEAAQAAEKHYGKRVELHRDEDVLDTWFSSALWPFSTLGWPDNEDEVKRYYPTDVLVTGFDIIFFWVARMMMMGLHFMNEVPFHTIYVHALVRDEYGAKMSKSKGNVMDPLELVDEYGADAVRFTLAAMAAQGRDIKMAKSRVEGYRNFATKLWNAARFAEINKCQRTDDFQPTSVTHHINRWICGEVESMIRNVTDSIEAYRYNEAASLIYQFIWGIFCDWYLEFIKPVMYGDDELAKAETRATTAWVLDNALIALHPFMPFITEEIWNKTAEHESGRNTMLIEANWPVLDDLVDEKIRKEINQVIELITAIRSVRSEMNVPAGTKVPLVMVAASKEDIGLVTKHASIIRQIARVENISQADVSPEGSVQIILDNRVLAMPLKGVVDIDAECARLEKQIDKLAGEISQIDKKLANEKFIANAPEKVIEGQRSRKARAEETRNGLKAALQRFEGI
jgi:valyl-tRNA synthetase